MSFSHLYICAQDKDKSAASKGSAVKFKMGMEILW